MPGNLAPLLPYGPTGPGGLSPLGRPGLARRGPEQARRLLGPAAQEVEALFLEKLLEQMRRALVEPVKPSSQQWRGYQSIADQHLARTLAAGGGLGLARKIQESLARRQPRPQPEKEHAGPCPSPESPAPGQWPGDEPVPATP